MTLLDRRLPRPQDDERGSQEERNGPGVQRPPDEEEDPSRVHRVADEPVRAGLDELRSLDRFGNGVSARPSALADKAATAAPKIATTAPTAKRIPLAPDGQSGGITTATMTRTINANCATTQPPPRPLTELDEADVVEARLVKRPDQLGRRGRVDREDHQRLSALLGA